MIGQKGVPARTGGIERHVEELAAELVCQGHEVTVFCRSWYSGPIREHRGIRCVTTPSLFTKHFDAITHTFTSIVRAVREGHDIIHIHGVGPCLLAWLPKLLRPNVKVVTTFHCIDRHHQKWNWFAKTMLHVGEWMACRFSNATITVSKTLQAYCRLSYGADTMYIPNGTAIPTHQPDPSLLAPFKLTKGKYLMMCSRLVRHKGAHVLMESWKQLKKQQPTLTKDMKLVIVGGGAFTDDYVKELKDLAKDEPSIVMTGTQTGEILHTLFSGAYAVVHPSESEGLPIAVLEAMSYGKCVLSSDIPENSELTRELGRRFRTGSVKQLTKELEWLLTHKKDVAAIGKKARIYVATHFDWKDIADMTSCLYDILDFHPSMQEAMKQAS